MQRAAYIDAVREARAEQRFSECRYRVTDLGVIVWQAAQVFYASFDAPPADLDAVATDEAEFAGHSPSQRRVLVQRKYAKALKKAFLYKLKARSRRID